MIRIYIDETRSERTAFDAVAIKATASVGRGSNALSYQAKDISGRWHCITKKHNPTIPTIKKSDIRWDNWVNGGRCAYGESGEVPV